MRTIDGFVLFMIDCQGRRRRSARALRNVRAANRNRNPAGNRNPIEVRQPLAERLALGGAEHRESNPRQTTRWPHGSMLA
jgi:hypothetical protein